MRIVLVPDCHMKPEIIDGAIEIRRMGKADGIVCLMDLADDWNKGLNVELYIQTYAKAIELKKRFPDTLFTIGNHDFAYLHGFSGNAGYSLAASANVKYLLNRLIGIGDVKVCHRVDNVLFSHAGICEEFISRNHIKSSGIDEVIACINTLSPNELWTDESPLRARPQYGKLKMYRENEFIQVVGHNPMPRIQRIGNLISCDTFSTRSDGSQIGDRSYLIIDTESGNCFKCSRGSESKPL